MQKTQIYKGIDLLEKILEFVAMTPETNLWTLNSLIDNQPRLIRLKQINSLLNAFFSEKNETIQSILSGKFLETQNIELFSELTNFIIKFVKSKSNFEIEDDEIYVDDLQMVYCELMQYKKVLRNLLTFNSGWLEASSVTAKFSICLTNSITENLINKYPALNETLEMLVNPKKLSFTEMQLINEYNFPTDDLYEIDIENW